VNVVSHVIVSISAAEVLQALVPGSQLHLLVTFPMLPTPIRSLFGIEVPMGSLVRFSRLQPFTLATS
jgi:hypothetical protein